MKIAIIGTGYVGLPTGVGFAQLGHNVICVDKIKEKIDTLKRGELPIYEENLAQIFAQNVANGNLSFTTSMKKAVTDADLVILAVGTPEHPITHEADLKYIYAAATELASYLNGYTVIATKSTVPVGTGDDIEQLIRTKNPTARFDVISLPEFLREGFAINDFFHPDRIVIGTDSQKAAALLKELYAPFADQTEILFMKRRSAETVKYASNAFLAVKIHYINEMADFCEKSGAEISDVALGMGLDKRIGPRFLNPGPGYGGSCFPKDTMAMAHMARQNNVEMSLINAAINGNVKRKKQMAERILEALKNIKKPQICVLGLAFKNSTDDCRQSPAIEIITHLLQIAPDIQITAYDPKAMGNACLIFDNKISYADDMYSALKNTDALVILTEWEEFKNLDLKVAATLMRGNKIIDFRNMLNKNEALKNGFSYQGVGR